MTNEELGRLERICEAATPGPWEAERIQLSDGTEWWAMAPMSKRLFSVAVITNEHGQTNEASNASFIAASRTALPSLIAEVRRLRERVAELETEQLCFRCGGTGKMLARQQPCGCVVCSCEDDERCHGCGACACGGGDKCAVGTKWAVFTECDKCAAAEGGDGGE